MVEELKTIEMGFSDYIAIKQKEFDWLRQGKEEGYAHGLEAGLEQGREEGLEQGREEGLEQGAYQKALETAKTMVSIGLSEEQIQLCTKLPLETIHELMKG